jgi:hypothetical protein
MPSGDASRKCKEFLKTHHRGKEGAEAGGKKEEVGGKRDEGRWEKG